MDAPFQLVGADKIVARWGEWIVFHDFYLLNAPAAGSVGPRGQRSLNNSLERCRFSLTRDHRTYSLKPSGSVKLPVKRSSDAI